MLSKGLINSITSLIHEGVRKVEWMLACSHAACQIMQSDMPAKFVALFRFCRRRKQVFLFFRHHDVIIINAPSVALQRASSQEEVRKGSYH